ncbi:PREDICTED: nuclease SbcCD subunit C-like isoform X2 [Diuraphis noxia]|uniref:nuclease SbcCD subunit C-like isoform X2 n=1 Tax=Diuraphis noxia TaxID=143948 RepID=UPI0007637999|nr:PREDICTED: nuclease SbcCD subunit C-like isoform X2 [Diuraphis noxia]
MNSTSELLTKNLRPLPIRNPFSRVKKMGVDIDSVINEIKFDQKLISVFNTYNKYVNFRFDYVIRTSINQLPDELNHNVDDSEFNPSQHILLDCVNSNNSLDNVTKLREELKTLTAEVNLKRKELSIISINEDGLKINIKHLEDIISIKKNFISETASYAEIRCNAKEKVQKEYNRINKKYKKILSQLNKSNKMSKTSYGDGTSKENDYGEQTNNRLLRYEDKIKKMDDIIKIASDSTEKLLQYQIALKTSNDRLKMFYDQLNNQIKSKQEVSLLLIQHEKRINQLKTDLSNLGVLSSVEKSRVHTSSNLIRNDNLKKEFLDLQNMRNEILSSRPRGMFNPKYQKENNLTKEDIRKYLENDEAIDSIDYLIELKNNMCNNDSNLLHFIQMNSNETTVFWKCLSTLSIDELKKLLVHYFIKVVDLKESGRENDEIISKLDSINDRQRHTIVSLNNDYQEFHLSIEKKFMELKKYYQTKVNMLFQLVQEENNAITMFKTRQEILGLKKKIIELEKLQTVKPKDTSVVQEPHTCSNLLEASKSESETMSSAKVIYHKNKLKIQKNKSKLI